MQTAFRSEECFTQAHVFGSSTGYELPSGDTLQPDLSFISTARWKAGPAPKRPNDFLRIVPDLVVEILSPSTAKRDRTEKLEIYTSNGVDEVWIVDAERREVTVFHCEGGRPVRSSSVKRGRIPSRVLSGLELGVEGVFAEATAG
jgi:Uma2 family endonuclease